MVYDYVTIYDIENMEVPALILPVLKPLPEKGDVLGIAASLGADGPCSFETMGLRFTMPMGRLELGRAPIVSADSALETLEKAAIRLSRQGLRGERAYWRALALAMIGPCQVCGYVGPLTETCPECGLWHVTEVN